jgi:UDP-N-acetyl-D-mannosaminuronic acid dehydrogenase
MADGARNQALIVDPWDCFGAAQIFAYADEIAPVAASR